jgi:hypothetical protein
VAVYDGERLAPACASPGRRSIERRDTTILGRRRSRAGRAAGDLVIEVGMAG